jgi:hypothetical protein
MGLGNCHSDKKDYASALVSFDLAIERIKADKCPMDHADTHAQTLQHIAGVHLVKALKAAEETDATKEWTECLAFATQSVEIRESKHARDHISTAAALGMTAFAHGKLGNEEKEMELQLRVLKIKSKAKGLLSVETAFTCHNIGEAHRRANRDLEAVYYFKQAFDGAMYSAGGLENSFDGTQQFRKDLIEALKAAVPKLDTADPRVVEYKQLLETT